MKTTPINYKHLYYFWVTAREGSLSRAAESLGLSAQTMSEQITLLEKDLGRSLFTLSGRRLVPTEAGRVAAGYADQIFELGANLKLALQDSELDGVIRLAVGISDALPKLVAYRLVKSALDLPQPIRLSCFEGEFDELLGDLARHRLDVVLTDRPVATGGSLRVFNHVLGDYEVGLFAMPELAGRYADALAACLDRAPLLLPTRTNALRNRLDQWFEAHGVKPLIVAEFEDSALLMTVGRSGRGLFPAPLALADDVLEQFGARLVGPIAGVREQFYAISSERKIRHPGVEAILKSSEIRRPGEARPVS